MNNATRLLFFVIAGMVLLLTGCDTLTGSSQIQDLETQNAQMQGTIQVMGTPALTIAALELAATQNVIFQAQLTESAVNLLKAQSTLTVLELGGASSAGVSASPIIATPAPVPLGDQPAAVPTPAPTAAPSLTSFSNTVVATGLDNQDCPVGVSSLIPDDTPLVYVNTRIDLLVAGSQIGARWYVNGELYFDDVECWVPRQNWENICAYCTVSPDGATFPDGSWTVELYLDGQLMSQTRFDTYNANAEPGSVDPNARQ